MKRKGKARILMDGLDTLCLSPKTCEEELRRLLGPRRPNEGFGITHEMVAEQRRLAIQSGDQNEILKADLMQAHVEHLRVDQIAERFDVSEEFIREIFDKVRDDVNRTRRAKGMSELPIKSIREQIVAQIMVTHSALNEYRDMRNIDISRADRHPLNDHEIHLLEKIVDLTEARDEKDRARQVRILARYLE